MPDQRSLNPRSLLLSIQQELLEQLVSQKQLICKLQNKTSVLQVNSRLQESLVNVEFKKVAGVVDESGVNYPKTLTNKLWKQNFWTWENRKRKTSELYSCSRLIFCNVLLESHELIQMCAVRIALTKSAELFSVLFSTSTVCLGSNVKSYVTVTSSAWPWGLSTDSWTPTLLWNLASNE